MDDANHLVRPIAIRPTHALPPPAVASTSTSTSTSTRRRGVPLKRSRIRVINTALWQPTHLGAEDLKSQSTDEEMEADGWVFESDEEGEDDEEGRKLIGRWIKNDGEEDEEVEEVWIQGRRVQDQGLEEEDPLNDFIPAENRDRSASPLFASHRPARSASPLFPGRQTSTSPQPPAEEDGASQSADGEEVASSRAADDVMAESDTLDEEISPESPARSRSDKSASPLFPTRRPAAPDSKPAVATKIQTAPLPTPVLASQQPTVTPRTVAIAEPVTHVLPDPVREVALAERSRDLGLLASFLGEEVSAPGKPTKGEWAGFDEDDDDEDDEDIYPLRLRGGKADSDDEDMDGSSSSDSSDDSDSDDEEESDDEDEAGDAKPNGTSTVTVTKVEPAVKPAAVTPKPQSALKAMFAPAPTTSSFSLLGALDADIELDEELDIPLAPPPVYRTAEPEPELQPLSQSKKAHFDPDPSIPLFFPSFGKGGKDAMREETTKEGYVGFWKQETDEEMKEIWEKDKLELTRDWKKRYRDGKKQKKRRGGANDVE